MEQRLEAIERSVMKLDSRMEVVLSSIEKMANGIEKLSHVGHTIHVLEERCEARTNRFDEADKVLHKRVDATKLEFDKDLNELNIRIDKALDKLTSNQNKGMWMIIGLVVVGVGKVIFVGV